MMFFKIIAAFIYLNISRSSSNICRACPPGALCGGTVITPSVVPYSTLSKMENEHSITMESLWKLRSSLHAIEDGVSGGNDGSGGGSRTFESIKKEKARTETRRFWKIDPVLLKARLVNMKEFDEDPTPW